MAVYGPDDDLSGLNSPPEAYPGWLASVLRYTGAINDANAQLRTGSPPNSNVPPTLGPVAPIQSAAQIPPNLPPGQTAAPFQQPAHPSTMRYPMWPTPPAPAAAPVVASAPTPPARPVTPTPATAYPRTTAPASVAAAPAPAPVANPNDWLIDRPNASATGWNPGAPKMTAGNLSGLFGGLFGGGANPANVPAANAQPVSALRGGALAKNSALARAPLPPRKPASIRNIQAGAVVPESF